MDRVLLIIDDIQFNRQLEMTLRKVGFEVESVNNEFTFTEPLLSFNPDYIIVRGNSSRLSVLNVGKKLRENASHNNGKVILIFPENVKLSGDDLFKIRSDLILNEPIGTLRLVLYVISLTGQDMESVKEKLMKYALTDPQFRTNEQLILKNAGITVDAEIEILSNMESLPALPGSGILYRPDQINQVNDDAKDLGAVVFKDEQQPKSNLNILTSKGGEDPGVIVQEGLKAKDFEITDAIKDRINEEVRVTKQELPLRIETYNRSINKVDQDLKIGLKKRQTKKEFNQLHKDLLNANKTDKNSEDDLDKERVKFAKALFGKK